MRKIGVIGVKGGWSSERLADAVNEITGFRCLIDLREMVFDSAGDKVTCGGVDLAEMDALIIKKVAEEYSSDLLDRLTILDHLQRKGVKIFSPPNAIMPILNRLGCTLDLARKGVPIPETVVTEDRLVAGEAIKRFSKAVLKPLYTSKARGMVLTEYGPQTTQIIEDFIKAGNSMMYIQKFVNLPGKDLGITFLNGEYLATYARVADGTSWNTTTFYGGKYYPYEPSPDLIELARKAQAGTGLFFTCVDLVETDEGPKIFEVSAFGGFKGLWEANKIDAARLIVEEILKVM